MDIVQVLEIIGFIISSFFGINAFKQHSNNFPYSAWIWHFIGCLIFSVLLLSYFPDIRSHLETVFLIWTFIFLVIIIDTVLEKPLLQGLIFLVISGIYATYKIFPKLNGVNQLDWITLANFTIRLILINLHSLAGIKFFGAMIRKEFIKIDIAILISVDYIWCITLLLLIGSGIKL